jgi:hypothetical protein
MSESPQESKPLQPIVGQIFPPMGYCLHCIGAYLAKKVEDAKEQAKTNGGDGSFSLSYDDVISNCNIAITLAPTWQQMNLGGGNVVMGSCAVPTCPVHLVQQTAQQAGRSQSGLLVPGQLN